MSNTYAPDAGDIRLLSGAHVGALFNGAGQRDDLIRAFLSEGLQDSDKCVCVAAAEEPATIMDATGVDVGACLASHRIEQLRSRQAYLPEGVFDSLQAFTQWAAIFDEAIAEDFTGIRLAAELPAEMCAEPNRHELFRYELAYNEIFTGYPLRTICLYDLGTVDAAIFLTILRTHPLMLIDGELIDNGRYVGRT